MLERHGGFLETHQLGESRYATRLDTDAVDAFPKLGRGLNEMLRPDSTGLSGGFADETEAAAYLCR